MLKKRENKFEYLILLVIVYVGLVSGAVLINNSHSLKNVNVNLKIPEAKPMLPMRPTPFPTPQASLNLGNMVEYKYDSFGFKFVCPSNKYLGIEEGFRLDKQRNVYNPYIALRSRGESPCNLSQCSDFEIQIIIRNYDDYGPFADFEPTTYDIPVVINGVSGFRTAKHLDPIENRFSVKLPNDKYFYIIQINYQDKYKQIIDKIIYSFEVIN